MAAGWLSRAVTERSPHATPNTPRKINLALQGGGAHGAVTWGVLDRLLEEENLDIDGLSGTSAGAVNAAALAYGIHLGGSQGGREKLEELWRAISEAGASYSPSNTHPSPYLQCYLSSSTSFPLPFPYSLIATFRSRELNC